MIINIGLSLLFIILTSVQSLDIYDSQVYLGDNYDLNEEPVLKRILKQQRDQLQQDQPKKENKDTIQNSKIEILKSQPIRIKFDYDLMMNRTDISEGTKQLNIDALESAALYFANLIKLVPDTQPLSLDRNKFQQCFNMSFSEKVYAPNQIKDVDFFVMVSGYTGVKTLKIAEAVPCYVRSRVLMGRIIINFDKLNENDVKKSYDYMMRIFIHELIHILGFSQQLFGFWTDPKTNIPFAVSTNKSFIFNHTYEQTTYTLLKAKPLIDLFQTHYQCLDFQGFPIDMQSKSHWQQDTIRDEIMNPVVYNYASDVTQFSASLLRNTNFYSEVNDNFATFSGWGYKKGCQYFAQQQTLSQNSPKQVDGQCDPAGYGKYSSKYNYTRQRVQYYKSDNQYCTELKLEQSASSQELFSSDSKCFTSNLQKNTILSPFFSQFRKTRCFNTKCIDDKLQLTTQSGLTYDCNYPGSYMEISEKNIRGYIKCPSNLDIYCNRKLFCKNDCSLKGFCLKSGICVCREGNGGIDCTQKLEIGEVIYKKEILKKCPDSTYSNPNKVCMEDCPEGYFKSQDQTCQKCHFRCKQCNGTLESNCLSCTFNYHLSNGKCAEKYICSQKKPQKNKNCLTCADDICITCESKFYLNSEKQCVPCTQNCESCYKSEGFCTKCSPGYLLSKNSCISMDQTAPGCQTLHPNDPDRCLQCSEGYYIDKNDKCHFCEVGQYYDEDENECKKCDGNCLTCINKPNICTSCDKNIFLNMKASTCIPIKSSVIKQEIKVDSEAKKNEKTNSNAFSDGEIYYYDENKNCHYSCDLCNDSSYASCFVCDGNREFVTTSVSTINQCKCSDEATDLGEYGCLYDYNFQQAYFAFITIMVVGLFYEIFKVIFQKKNIFNVLIYIDFLQFLAYLRFINTSFQLSLDAFWKSLQFSNIFNLQIIFTNEQTNEYIDVNPKILIDQKTPIFFYNCLILIIVLTLMNTTYSIFQRFGLIDKYQISKQFQYFIVAVNIFSIQEITLNMCAGISLFQINPRGSTINFILGIFLFIFVSAQTIYFIKNLLNYKIGQDPSNLNKNNIESGSSKLPSTQVIIQTKQQISEDNSKGQTQLVLQSKQYISEDNFSSKVQNENEFNNDENSSPVKLLKKQNSVSVSEKSQQFDQMKTNQKINDQVDDYAPKKILAYNIPSQFQIEDEINRMNNGSVINLDTLLSNSEIVKKSKLIVLCFIIFFTKTLNAILFSQTHSNMKPVLIVIGVTYLIRLIVIMLVTSLDRSTKFNLIYKQCQILCLISLYLIPQFMTTTSVIEIILACIMIILSIFDTLLSILINMAINIILIIKELILKILKK